MQTLTVIVGKTYSGKSYLLKEMEEKGFGHSVTLNTTRPMRDGEVDGVDYYFDEKDELLKAVTEEKCILTSYNVFENGKRNKWYYALFLNEILASDKPIVIIDVDKLNILINWSVEYCFNIKIVYVDTPLDTIKRRIQTSSRNKEAFDETTRRLEDDNRKFTQFEENIKGLGLKGNQLRDIDIYKISEMKEILK